MRILRENGLEAYRHSPLEAGGRKGDVVLEDFGKIEVKRGNHVPKRLYDWLKKGRALAVRRDREGWLVVMPLAEFLNLVKDAAGKG